MPNPGRRASNFWNGYRPRTPVVTRTLCCERCSGGSRSGGPKAHMNWCSAPCGKTPRRGQHQRRRVHAAREQSDEAMTNLLGEPIDARQYDASPRLSRYKCGHHLAQELSCDMACGSLVQLDKGELAGPVYGDEQVQLTLFGTHLGDIDVDVANRVALETSSVWVCPRRSVAAWRCRGAADSGVATIGSGAG